MQTRNGTICCGSPHNNLALASMNITHTFLQHMRRPLISSPHFFPIFLLFLLSLFALSWQDSGQIINHYDNGFPLNPASDIVRHWFRWDGSRGLGIPEDRSAARILPLDLWMYVAELLHGNVSIGQRSLWVALFFLSGLSCYIMLAHSMVDGPHFRTSFAFVSSLFYMANPWLWQYRWGNGFILAMFSYSILPLLLT